MLREDRYKKRMILGQEGNSLMTILAVLAIVFCIFKFISIVYDLVLQSGASYRSDVFNWFALPANPENLLYRPWTLITYMFMHDGVFHLLGNLLWLWAFGFILQDLAGNKKIFPVFIYGGLAGGLIFLLSFNLIPALVPMVPVSTLEGASAGVMAIAIAATTLSPNYRIFPMIGGGIPLWVLTLIFVIIDFASIQGQNGGGHLAHLAGAGAGFLFIKLMDRGYDGSRPFEMFSTWAGQLFSPDKKSWKKTAKKEFYYNTGGKEPFRKTPIITQKRVDDLLDKINQKGFHSLSEEEKEILKRAAQNEEL